MRQRVKFKKEPAWDKNCLEESTVNRLKSWRYIRKNLKYWSMKKVTTMSIPYDPKILQLRIYLKEANDIYT